MSPTSKTMSKTTLSQFLAPEIVIETTNQPAKVGWCLIRVIWVLPYSLSVTLICLARDLVTISRCPAKAWVVVRHNPLTFVLVIAVRTRVFNRHK